MSAYVPQPYNERLDSLADLTAPSLTGLLAMNSSGDLVEGGTVQSFGGYNLVQKSATSGGTWGPMDGSAIMFLGDTAYLIGGWYGDIANADWTGNITTNLVYRSTNFGVTWTRIRDHDLTPDSTHFTPRHASPHCVHRVGSTDYMYLFSGDNSEPNSDVRRSTDGITWTKVNSVAPGYDGLSSAAAGSLNGNLYLVGGATVPDTAGHKNAVWRSTDNGVTWTNLGNAPWAIRSTVDRLVNHDGKLWLIGGGIYDDTLGRTYYNDVWSFDGTTWTEVLEDGHSQWTARMYAATFAIGGWLYISRGYNAANLSDTFRSRDGITWFPVNITLEASHADAIGTHADGALIGPGNGLLTNNVNTNSPTRWLEVTGSDDDLPTSIASMISSAQVNPNPEFATIILGLFLYTESGQIGIGEDASGFYVCAGATDSNKTINIGSDATPEIRVKATRLEVSGTIFATALALTNGSNKPLTSFRDASYSGWHNGTSLISNEAYIMGSNAHYFSVGGTNRLEIASGSQFNGALTVTGLLNIGSADCRMFRDSGNLYFESDGNFSFQDTSSSATLMLLANDGRLFLKTNVWHPDSDGNARLLYNGSGGATNFNGAYNFVSSDRGHGLYSDGSIRWGQDQVSNSRGLLSWGPDLAIVTSPLNMDIICGGAMGLTAPSGFTFNGLVACDTATYPQFALKLSGVSKGVLWYDSVNSRMTLGSGSTSNGMSLDASGNATFWGNTIVGSGTSSPIVRINGGSTIGIGASIEFQAAGSTIGYVGRASYVSSGGINTSDMAYYAHTGLGHNFIVNGGFSSAFSVTSAGNITATGTAKLGDFTVATLPSAATYAGHECNVTDSSVTTFGSTVAGGGSSRVKLYSNGTNWTVQAA